MDQEDVRGEAYTVYMPQRGLQVFFFCQALSVKTVLNFYSIDTHFYASTTDRF